MITLLWAAFWVWLVVAALVFLVTAFLWALTHYDDPHYRDDDAAKKLAGYAVTAWAWPLYVIAMLRQMWRMGMERKP